MAVDGVFVGRGVELAFLLGRLEQSLTGMSRTVLLEGAAGAGKTALLDAFLARAGHHRVLRTSGAELEAGLVYGVVDQLVAETGQRPLERLAGLGTEWAADVEPLRIGGALVEMLGRLQDGGQLLVVLDDAHWADIPSLQALAFALRRLRSSPVLALLSVRDDRTDHLLTSLHGLLTGPTAARLRLGGLGIEELRELSTALGTGSLSPRAARRLHEHTGGNPLHARALLEEIPAAVLRHGVGPLPAPRSFALLVLARLASCPPDAENLVVAASVLGTSCPLRLASRLGEVTDPLEALEQAAAAHLLCDHPTAIERLITFRHPLVRAAIYHDLGPARRADLHARAAQLVENEPAALRHKVAAACGPDPQLAAEFAALASRLAAVGSWTAAADSLLAAARLATTPAERERSVLTAMDYLRMGGNEAEASTLADELAALAEGVHEGHGPARLAGDCHDDEPDSQPRLAAAISLQLGVLDACGDAAAAWARQALAAAAPHLSAATQPCYVRLSGRPLNGGSPDGCGPISLHQPIRLPQPPCLGGGSPTFSGPDRRICHGISRAWTDDLAGARDDLTSALTACQRYGSLLPWGLIGLGFLAETEYRLGSWDDAIAHAELAVSIVQDAGQHWLGPFIHAVAAFPLAARGAIEAATAHATEAAAQLQLAGTENCAIWVATAQALLAQAEGDDRRIASVLKPLHLTGLRPSPPSHDVVAG